MPPYSGAAFNDAYEVHDPATFTTHLRHRQQQAASSNPTSLPAGLAQKHPPQEHRQLGFSTQDHRRHHHRGRRHHHDRQADELTKEPSDIPVPRPAFSEAQTEDAAGSTVDDPYQQLDQSYWPQRRHHGDVSERTSSAILWVLEEGIRRPFPFTPVWPELSASMSELDTPPVMSGIDSGVGGGGRIPSSSSRAPAQGAVPVQQQPPPSSGVKTPTDIMRQRRDREARRRAEQEAVDREQQQQQQQRRRSEQSRQTQRQPRTQESPTTASQQKPVRQPQQPQPQPQQQQEPGGYRSSTSRGAPDLAHQQAAQKLQGQTVQVNSPPVQAQRRSTFPHAFERWESLSSHWEGLTGYWIRKLEQNGDALGSDPISQQMSRQVTDLSAAGANLFHAVVELQRLRASSERKFQRWFFDIRAEQEKAREVQAELERQLKAERRAHAETRSTFQSNENERAINDELLREMRRELQISKEEARRAWEELGRREQEERSRTHSLRIGEPTLVGGVQVVPMIQGFPQARHHGGGSGGGGGVGSGSSRPPTRASGGPGPANISGQTAAPQEQNTSSREVKADDDQFYEVRSVSSTGTDPFTHEEPVVTTATAAVPSSSSPSAVAAGSAKVPTIAPLKASAAKVPETAPAAAPSRASYQEGEQHYGGTPRDDDVHSITSSIKEEEDAAQEEYDDFDAHHLSYPPTLSDESDDYSPQEVGFAGSGVYGATSRIYPGYYPEPVDYSGASWGSEWDSITPRHRHPTRLSDVMEEDEPSRTTPSRASLASRSLHFS